MAALGPAVVSGKSIFIYGPPGNGKTAIANSIGDFMNRAGGAIYVPYAFQSEGNIVTVYEVGSEEGADFIAMELVRGQTLTERLRS